jgi:hypothetical protein
MKLSAPSLGMFLSSTFIIAVIVASNFFGLDVPVLSVLATGHPFESALAAWFLLFLGVAFNF